jgi:hypothetical protein
MGIDIRWDNPDQTRFVYHFEAQWTWDEFFVAKEQAKTLLDVANHKFVVIIDLTEVSRLPADSLAKARYALTNGHPNAFYIVLVVPNAIVRTIIGTLRDIAPITNRTLEFAATLDEARDLADTRLLADNTAHTPGG